MTLFIQPWMRERNNISIHEPFHLNQQTDSRSQMRSLCCSRARKSITAHSEWIPLLIKQWSTLCHSDFKRYYYSHNFGTITETHSLKWLTVVITYWAPTEFYNIYLSGIEIKYYLHGCHNSLFFWHKSSHLIEFVSKLEEKIIKWYEIRLIWVF